jgi:hypothetical protein
MDEVQMILGRHSTQLLLATIAFAAVGCIDDSHITLDKKSNEVRARSVRIDASQCLKKDGQFTDCKTEVAFNLRRVEQMRGVIGAPFSAIALDDAANARSNFGRLSPFWSRIPIGYGCGVTMQGVFNKPNPTDKAIADIKNYNLTQLSALIGEVRSNFAVVLWTAGYGLGDGSTACAYKAQSITSNGKAVPEQVGKPITDPAKWAKAVRRIAKYYNRDLPDNNKELSACKNPRSGSKAWDCTPSLFNIEFGRDPNGAGGFDDTTKSKWLESYTQFSTEMRKEFPWPDNSVRLLGPSVVINGELELNNTKPGTKRSWLFDFIDHVVAKKLSISHLSFEIVAKSPVEAFNIVEKVRNYVDAKKMKDDDGQPISLFVTDLRLNPVGLPAGVRDDPTRYSAYEGTFWAASKILWQGMVEGATVGRVMRFPTVDASNEKAETVAETALDSNLMWFTDSAITGAVKPGAWHSFWFNEGFLGGGGGKLDWEPDPTKATDTVAEARKKSILRVTHGPDAVGLGNGKEEVKMDRGLLVLATREQCVYPINDAKSAEPKDCVEDIDPNTGEKKTLFPAVTKGRTRAIRVMVADGDVQTSAKEILEHTLRVKIDNLPKDVKSVGFRWARMNGNAKTFTGFVFPEQGVIDVHGGKFTITRSVAVPSLHYFEFLY